MNGQLLLILNPAAGQRRANRYLPEIIRMIWDNGYTCVTFVTGKKDDARAYVARHADSFARIICIGGDGTLNETIAGVLQSGRDVPIGYVPAGTTNDYAYSLGLSHDVLVAARNALTGTPRPMDVGVFNGRYFTYTASCGAFARASYSTPQTLKNLLGHLAYILEGIKNLPSIRSCHIRVEADDRVLEDNFIFVAVLNSTSVGGILRLNAEMVSLDDGIFELLLIRYPETAMQLSSILYAITTMDFPNDMVWFLPAKRIRIFSDDSLEWTLDGEYAQGERETRIDNLHRAVQIVMSTEDAGGKDMEA